jgi:hypothetical protein
VRLGVEGRLRLLEPGWARTSGQEGEASRFVPATGSVVASPHGSSRRVWVRMATTGCHDRSVVGECEELVCGHEGIEQGVPSLVLTIIDLPWPAMEDEDDGIGRWFLLQTIETRES